MGTAAFGWRGRSTLALAAWLAAAGNAAAGSFSLAPIRLEMDKAHSTGVLTLHNDADAPVTIQIESLAWSQPEDADHYAPSRDLIVTPPVFVVPAKGEQIVRVARRVKGETTSEVPYRLFFQEVPDSTPQAGTGLKIALRVGIPVFVTAPGANADLSFTAQSDGKGGVEILATNKGRAHVQITDFEVTSEAGPVGSISGSRYLLPGASSHWTLNPSGATPTGLLKIRGHSDRGAITADVDLAAH